MPAIQQSAAGGGGGGLSEAEVTAIADTSAATASAALVDSSPAALDTLNELAAALGDDADFAATITAALAGKQPLVIGHFRSTASSSALATETVVHSFSVALPASRKVKVAMSGTIRGSSGTTTRRTGIIMLKQGTTTGGTQVLRADKVVTDDALERRSSFSISDVIQDTGAGGTIDYVITIQRANGANDVILEGATQPTVVTFEDFGPSS